MARRHTGLLATVAAVVSTSVAAPSRADDWGDRARGSQEPAPEGSNARSWRFGARASGSLAVVDRVHLCLRIIDSAVPPCPDDVWGYALAGLEVTAAFGRPSWHVKWLSSVDANYGPPMPGNAGALWAGRLVSGVLFLTRPEGRSSFLLEAQVGIAYYGAAHGGVSMPMISWSARTGGRFDHFDLLARVGIDSLFIESVVDAGVLIGYAP
jgi:hypothetical protein